MESTGDTAAPAEQLDINDPNVQERLVNELKEQGIFDQLRKDCLSDVDTKPGYQNLKQRVDKTLDQFLKNRTWNPGLSKNQLRSQLRQQIEKISGKDKQIERLVDQIVDPRLSKALTPEVEAMLVKYFGSLDETNEEEDVEMSDAIGQNGTAVETESINSEPGLEGRMSPLTPENNGENNRSPGVEGNISPLTPSTTPPIPQQQLHPTVVNMEVEGQVELQESYTPPPKESPSYTPPPRQEESPSYTPPPPHIIPQPNTTTPPPGEDGGPTLPYSSPTKYPSQPPPPGESSAGSGEDASMSSISDTEMADVSPPRPSNRETIEEN